MNSKASNKFFNKGGKTLKGLYLSRNEAIDSLWDYAQDSITSLESEINTTRQSFASKAILSISTRGLQIGNVLRKYYALSMNTFTWKNGVAWGVTPAILLTILTIGTSLFPVKAKIKTYEYNIFASQPLSIDKAESNIKTDDSRAHKINEVFKDYNCPLEGMGDVFVREAERNNIPWWLVASVSFQESGCGKVTPQPDGKESYNAWGWGIWGTNVSSFDNWARGVETVSKYFGDKFYAKGVTDTCEIMRTYTPPSNGSWCNGVNHFGDLIQNYSTP